MHYADEWNPENSKKIWNKKKKTFLFKKKCLNVFCRSLELSRVHALDVKQMLETFQKKVTNHQIIN